MDMPNPIHPGHMTPDERIGEVCRILARGLVRLKARQSRQVSGDRGESCLHFPPDRSGHGTPICKGDA
ncbi:hypothetical protein BSQ44_03765 [Aquibium oceanicum]|uniref:Uncharacterized protein n=1 Tax=Aquibium oceanicum TaxID=1670800 RepID=A0A1L3SMK3_9HYPH|nr:hypothetical protein BSQ44_03765 [Aquibium oceanicum]